MTQSTDAAPPKEQKAAKPRATKDDGAPFGTRPRYGMGPVWLWAALLAIWVAMMAWMSITAH